MDYTAIEPVDIKKIDHKNGIYFTVIDDMIFYNNHINFETHVKKGKGTYKIFELTCLNHNFYPFKHGKKIYAIGGQDNWKVDKKWRGLNYSQFQAVYEEHFNKPSIHTEEEFEIEKYKFDTTRHFPHCHGLYLLESFDVINWRFVKKDPIITVKNEGFISSLSWKSAEFDCKPSIVRYRNTWFLFIRANTNVNERQIQFSTSKDLIRWSNFRLIDVNFKEGQNYYHPVIIQHENRLIGFFNYYDNDVSCVRIMQSTNARRWQHVKDIFIEKPIGIEGNKKKLRSVCCSVEKKGLFVSVYMNHNFNQNDKDFKSYIIEYKIDIRWLNEILGLY